MKVMIKRVSSRIQLKIWGMIGSHHWVASKKMINMGIKSVIINNILKYKMNQNKKHLKIYSCAESLKLLSIGIPIEQK